LWGYPDLFARSSSGRPGQPADLVKPADVWSAPMR
jgi:hypothetical protein